MIVFVQARMSSRRLPGKVLMPLHGMPMLGYLLESLRHCQTIAQTVVLTSTEPSDDPIDEFCAGNGTPCFRGDLHDVTARFLAAASAFHADAFVRISGDSPLLDHRIVDRAVRLFYEAPCDLVTNALVRTFPKGQSVEAVSHEAVRRTYTTMTPDEREHVTQHIYRNPDQFTIRDFRFHEDRGALQMAVDAPADIARIEACLQTLGNEPWRTPLEDMLRHF